MKGVIMCYKFNNGNGAYICDRCSKTLSTGEEAIEMSKLEEDIYCEECQDDLKQLEIQGD